MISKELISQFIKTTTLKVKGKLSEVELRWVYSEEDCIELIQKALKHFRDLHPKHTCEYVKKYGESCTLNNNCKYPNCTPE